MLKTGADRLRTMVTMRIASAALAVLALPFVEAPSPESWWLLGVSALLHVFYDLFLVRAYRHGDLGQIYPLARGASPLLITVGAALFAGELPSALTIIGIAIVSVGVLSLAREFAARGPRTEIGLALWTGALIAAYTLVDGSGARASGSTIGYIAWLFVLGGLPMPLIFRCLRRKQGPAAVAPWTATRAAAGGIISLLAYALVIWAATMGPMGMVSALRETSVVFAALIGRIALSETLSRRRLIACIAVAAGAVCLGLRI